MTDIKNRVAELQQTISASRLNTFHQCRLKFFFRYVEKIEKPTSPALFIGKTVHAILQVWNIARWRGETRDSEFFRQLFEQLWSNPESNIGIRWEEKEEAQKQTAWNMIETYFRETTIPPGEKPLGVEVSVEADLVQRGLPKLIGIIDLVRPGGRIVDFKTSSTTPNPERSAHQNGLQLACYGLLYREATGEKESGFELHHLVKLKTPKVVISTLGAVTPSQENRLYRSIESYLEGLDRMDFVPSPGMTCLSCEYWGNCQKWTGEHSGLAERKLAA
ncbi:MAG: PD-(D/E)XK nuclease family protein [Chthoniobacterales bacterium]